MSDFGEGKTVKARKMHRCEWCFQLIEVGAQCFNYRGMFQGDWQNWYMHPECERVSRDNSDVDDGFMPGEGERPVAEAGKSLEADPLRPPQCGQRLYLAGERVCFGEG